MHYDFSLIIQGILGYGVTIIVALGFQLVFSTSRMFHFAYIGLYSLIIYMAYWAQGLSMPLYAQILIGTATAVAATAVMEYLVYRPMRKRGSSPLVILIASLGMLTALQNGIALGFGSQPVILTTPHFLAGKFVIGGFALSRLEFAQIIADVLMFAIIFVILRWTGFGILVRGVADDANRSGMMGVDVNRVIIAVLVMGTLMLVPVAILDGMNTGATPYGGTTTLLVASIIAFVGGIGSISGTMIVGLLAGIISGVSLLIVPSEWTVLIVFAALLLAILARPIGIMSSVKGRRTV